MTRAKALLFCSLLFCMAAVCACTKAAEQPAVYELTEKIDVGMTKAKVVKVIESSPYYIDKDTGTHWKIWATDDESEHGILKTPYVSVTFDGGGNVLSVTQEEVL